MKKCLMEYLFSKGILVQNERSEHPLEAMFAIAQLFNIRIVSGREYVHEDLIRFLCTVVGQYVPEPFYRGFPATVKTMTADTLLLDQLLHYTQTYGWGNFSEAGHSLFEENFERIAFSEKTQIKDFVILNDDEAVEKLKEYIENMLKGSRPLSDVNYKTVLCFIREYNYQIECCVCKDTAIKLLLDTRDIHYTRFLYLSDVIKLVDQLNYLEYDNTNIKKLNLCNKDRKFITAVIDSMFQGFTDNVKDCFEKKAIWCGLLHHIHYVAKTPDAERFVNLMRGNTNESTYSKFEQHMAEGDVQRAVNVLIAGKGTGTLLRNLNYIISRCKDETDIKYVLNKIYATNPIILIQLLIQYETYVNDMGRTFKFTRYNHLLVHTESEEEQKRRKSMLTPEQVNMLVSKVREMLEDVLRNKLGKVYVSPKMYDIAVPIQENTSQGGYGVLPKGSRIHMEEGKKIRAFTYWEKVNDIDLSVIGITEDGMQREYSWRTMYGLQSDELCYSGDETSGYYGGSEYFDVDVELFKERNPEIRYLVFSNNVYSNATFNECVCKAGYMLRDIQDSGEVFEPKSVQSSFRINCDSTMAYLFGIDLATNDFVWLNVARQGDTHVAGTTSLAFLTQYFRYTSILNIGSLFELMATEIVDDPAKAEVVVTDEEVEITENAQLIRSYDCEKITALLN